MDLLPPSSDLLVKRNDGDDDEVSWDVDLPPVSIVRAIILNRVDEAYPDWNFPTVRDRSRTLLVDKHYCEPGEGESQLGYGSMVFP
jgi:hypothetical protein